VLHYSVELLVLMERARGALSTDFEVGGFRVSLLTFTEFEANIVPVCFIPVVSNVFEK
jgi:hypothetical protein